MIKTQVINEFLGKIDGIEINDESVFYNTLEVIRLIETKHKIDIKKDFILLIAEVFTQETDYSIDANNFFNKTTFKNKLMILINNDNTLEEAKDYLKAILE